MTKNYFPKSILPIMMIAAAAALAGCASPGIKAAQRGDSAQMQQILDQPNHGNEDLNWLLFYSVNYDCTDCARILLKMGVKPNSGVLANAAINGHEKTASLLMDYGAEPTAAISTVRQNAANLRAAEFLVTETERQADEQQLRLVTEFFAKVERDRASRPAAAEPAALSAASAPAVAAAEPLRSRASPLFHEAEHADDYALIVGVEKYEDLPPAIYAGRDAAAATDFVEAMGVPASNVVTLTDSHATRSGLAKKLEGWLSNNVNENSTVYFYYSGHGAPDTKTGEAYLVPFDGDPEYLDQTAYPLKRLYEKLNALKAKRVIVMLDSCFSGAGGRSVMTKGSRPLMTSVDTGFNTAGSKITVLAAAGSQQISGTNDEKGHGLFSYYLFNGLNGGAKNAAGQVTLQSLFDYLKPKVTDDAHRVNRDQVPQFQSGDAASAAVVLRGK